MLIIYAICAYVIIGEAVGFWQYTTDEDKVGITAFTYGSLWLFFLLVTILIYLLAYMMLYITCTISVVKSIANKAFRMNKKPLQPLASTMTTAFQNLADAMSQLFPPTK
jgi:hypothetical protein